MKILIISIIKYHIHTPVAGLTRRAEALRTSTGRHAILGGPPAVRQEAPPKHVIQGSSEAHRY